MRGGARESERRGKRERVRDGVRESERERDVRVCRSLSVPRRVHRSGTDSWRGDGRGERELGSNRCNVTTRMIFALRWGSDVSRFSVSLIVQKSRSLGECDILVKGIF